MAAGGGPMKTRPALSQAAREGGVLGQEAVARMDGVGAGCVRGFEDAVDAEIALADGRRADAHRLVGEGDVRRVLVGVGIDRDGAIAHRLGRAHDAPGDLAAVGDQDLAEGHHSVAHFGGRFSAKARRPSAASGLRRASANLSAAKSSTADSGSRADLHHDGLGERIGERRAAVDLLQHLFQLGVERRASPSPGRARCPRRSASAPLKRPPVSARWRVCGTPMRAATKGAIWAGTMPIAVSLMAKPRALGADRHVGDAEQAEAAGDGVALDSRDHDLRRGVHHLEEACRIRGC